MRYVAKHSILGLGATAVVPGQIVEAKLSAVADLVAREYGGNALTADGAALAPIGHDGMVLLLPPRRSFRAAVAKLKIELRHLPDLLRD